MTEQAVEAAEEMGATMRLLDQHVARNLSRDRAIKQVKGMWQTCGPNVREAFDLIIKEDCLPMLVAVADALQKNAN
jgi:hypothetical protein